MCRMLFKENMKKLKSRRTLFALIAVLLAVLSVALGLTFGKGSVAFADVQPRYSETYLSGYYVEYDIHSDRSIDITEDITVNFARGSTGFFRDIPYNAGELIKNVSVKELTAYGETGVDYSIYTESMGFLTLDIGDYSYKYGERTYRITYTYCLTKAQEGNDKLALAPIGAGWGCKIDNVTFKLILPNGYKENSVQCFKQVRGKNTGDVNVITYTENGRTVIETVEPVYLKGLSETTNEALRVDLEFKEGSLTTYFDFTPFWFVLGGVAILLLLVAVKLACFNKLKVIPVVNFEAPEKMDPLFMGKLIDNKVNSEDITSMIFYWADKGYIKINIQDKNDPVLIRIRQSLPADSPAYEVTLYNELFSRGDTVKTGDLKYRFYTTVDKVTKMVNSRARGLYNSVSIGVSILFAILGAMLMGATPLALAMTQVSSKYLIIVPFMSFVPLFFVFASTEIVKYNTLKFDRKRKLAWAVGIFGVCAVLTAIYVFLVPSAILGTVAKIALSIVSCTIVVSSVLIVSRTKDYTKKLNDIVGFKHFITLTEKDRLEKMLESDPQFYYHILPYAQVLGVSDKWEDKFKDLTVEPPQWATSSSLNTFVEFHFLNTLIRQSASRMSSSMISRPSSSGSSGGSGHGGSFGGFSGGGHGGGGGRFR